MPNSGSCHSQSLHAGPLKVVGFARGAAEGPGPGSVLLRGVTLSKPPGLFGLRLLIYDSGGIMSPLGMNSSTAAQTVVLTNNIIPPGG